MPMTASILHVLLAAHDPLVHVITEKERIELAQTDKVRLTLPTQNDVEAWRNPGLTLQLGYGYSFVQGSGPAWSFRSHSAAVRPAVRLDLRWALGVGLLYGTGPNGARWSVTVEPSFFAWRQLALTVGLGYGGLSVNRALASTGRLRGPDVVVSRDLQAGETLPRCEGAGLSALARADYLFVVGPLFSLGPFVQTNSQWTRCHSTFGRVDPETGQSINLSQWWRQQGLSFGFWLAWR